MAFSPQGKILQDELEELKVARQISLDRNNYFSSRKKLLSDQLVKEDSEPDQGLWRTTNTLIMKTVRPSVFERGVRCYL